MSRKLRHKRGTSTKVMNETVQSEQGKKVAVIVGIATVLILTVLYFSFKSFAG